MRARLVLILALIVALPGLAQAASTAFPVSSTYQGRPLKLTGDLYRPPGPGPFPAVVLLHGCSGIQENHRQWAQLLADWGYAALLLDSLGPRGLHNVCRRRVLSPAQRAQDAYDAQAHLAGQPWVQKGRIAVLGWSQGGAGVLEAVSSQAFPKQEAFVAYIALYPRCKGSDPGRLKGPLLILAGAKDDWTPAKYCQQMASDLGRKNKTPVVIQVFGNAYHSYDRQRPPHTYLGHHLEYDPQATQASQQAVRAFLEKYLR